MEYELYPDGFLHDNEPPRPAPPLFEAEEPEASKENVSPLDGRVEALEYRLGRALLCLDRCQKEQAGLHRELRELAQEQQSFQERQERRCRAARYGAYALTGLILAALAGELAPLGWQLLDALASFGKAEPTMAAGLLTAAVLLWLMYRLSRAVVRRLLRRRKGGDENAVCDR